jgi:hypothetical protein
LERGTFQAEVGTSKLASNPKEHPCGGRIARSSLSVDCRQDAVAYGAGSSLDSSFGPTSSKLALICRLCRSRLRRFGRAPASAASCRASESSAVSWWTSPRRSSNSDLVWDISDSTPTAGIARGPPRGPTNTSASQMAREPAATAAIATMMSSSKITFYLAVASVVDITTRPKRTQVRRVSPRQRSSPRRRSQKRTKSVRG